MASAGFESPSTSGEVESALDGIEVEEIATHERAERSDRKRSGTHYSAADFATVIPVPDGERAGPATPERIAKRADSGRSLRYRHRSLLI